MHLIPRELDKLMLHQACFLAQKRYARGLLLNYPESMALLSGQLLEWIRDGESVSTLMDKGKHMLGHVDVMPGVADMIHEVQVEGTFPDGSKLVTVHQPICLEKGDPELVLYGSGLSQKVEPSAGQAKRYVGDGQPGEPLVGEGSIELSAGLPTLELTILNTGDRPIQVGSHYPFLETNRALKFDRRASYGYRLDIPAGTAVRFEPGESKKVQLVSFSGHRIFKGGNGQCQSISSSVSPLEEEQLDQLMEQMRAEGFQFSEASA